MSTELAGMEGGLVSYRKQTQALSLAVEAGIHWRTTNNFGGAYSIPFSQCRSLCIVLLFSAWEAMLQLIDLIPWRRKTLIVMLHILARTGCH